MDAAQIPEPSIARIGALIGVPARANMLAALMDGRALTATELTLAAGVSAQTASSHLAKLTEAGLLAAAQQGRHRYYRLAGPEVAEFLEPLTRLVGHRPVPHRRPSKQLLELRAARMCYDHLAGQLGVAIGQSLQARGLLAPEGTDFRLTEAGQDFLEGLGLDVAAARTRRRAFARQCLDWSERRPHLGGALGAALAQTLLDRKWIRRDLKGRKVTVTPGGRAALDEFFPEGTP